MLDYDSQWQCLRAANTLPVDPNQAHSYNGLVLTSGSMVIADSHLTPSDRGIFSFKVDGIVRDNATRTCEPVAICASCPSDDVALYTVPVGSSAFVNIEVNHINTNDQAAAYYGLFITVPMVDLSGFVYNEETLPNLAQCVRSWTMTGEVPLLTVPDLVIKDGEIVKVYHDSGWMAAFLMGVEYSIASGLYTPIALAAQDLGEGIWGDLYTCPAGVIFFGKLILAGAMETSAVITSAVLEGFGTPGYDGTPMPFPT